MNEELRKLYAQLLKDGALGKTPPAYEKFEAGMQNPETATKFHQMAVSNKREGIPTTFEQFQVQYGLKKKEQTGGQDSPVIPETTSPVESGEAPIVEQPDGVQKPPVDLQAMAVDGKAPTTEIDLEVAKKRENPALGLNLGFEEWIPRVDGQLGLPPKPEKTPMEVTGSVLEGLGNLKPKQKIPGIPDLGEISKRVSAGLRNDGTPKGIGFLGELPMADGSGMTATEMSVGIEIDGKETEIPTLVPTLSPDEVKYLLEGGDPLDRESPVANAIMDKAIKHAEERVKQKKSPFFEEGEKKEKSPEDVMNFLDEIRGISPEDRKYEKRKAELQEKYPVLKLENEVENIKFNRNQAKERGLTPKQYYDSRSSYIAGEFLAPNFRGEYDIMKGIEVQEKAIEDFAKNPNMYGQNDPKMQQQTLQKMMDELAVRKQSLQGYRENASKKIDETLRTMDEQLSALEASGQKESTEYSELLREREIVASEKEFFISPQKAMATAVANEPELGRIKSKEQLEELYNAWFTERYKIMEELGMEPGRWQEMQRLGQTFLPGGDPEKMKRLVELEDKLKTFAPVALINRGPITRENATDFGGSFAAGLLEVVAPATSGKPITKQIMSGLVLDVMGTLEVPVNENVVKVAEKGVQGPKFNTPDFWGSTLGTTAGFMGAFMAGEGILQATQLPRLAKGIKMASGIDDVVKASKYTKGGKFLYPTLRGIEIGVEEGLKYEAIGTLLGGSDIISEEGNFAVGAAGGILGKGTEKLLGNVGAAMLGMFGKQAPRVYKATEKFGRAVKVAGNINTRGIVESMEEYGNEVGAIFKESENWTEMKKLVEERFGTLDQNKEFFITTYLIGVGMGTPTAIGRWNTMKAKEVYDGMSPKDKKWADGVIAAIDEDMIVPTEEAVSEGIEVVEEVDAEKEAQEILRQFGEVTGKVVEVAPAEAAPEGKNEEVVAAIVPEESIAEEVVPEEAIVAETPVAEEVVAPAEEGVADEVPITDEEVREAISTVAQEMANAENLMRQEGFELDVDYDNEISITRNGEPVDPEDVPSGFLPLLRDYEMATRKLGDFDQKVLLEELAKARGVEQEAEVADVQPNEIETPTQDFPVIKSNKEIGEGFKNVIDKLGRDRTENLLMNWEEARLNEDGTKIVQYPGRDRQYSKGSDGGKVAGSKKRFIDWLLSDSPFDEKVYGKDIKNNKEWVEDINDAREALGYRPAAVAIEPAVEEVPTPVEEVKPEVKSEIKLPAPTNVNPEMAKARESGQRTTEGGGKYTRKPEVAPEKMVRGKQGKSTFKPKEATGIPFTYTLMAVEDVETTQKGTEWNPNNFIPESQPKPISPTRDLENKQRAEDFENELIGPSGVDPFKGFVNVNNRGEVFQGTGRWNILNYAKDNQQRIDYLKSVSEETGIAPEQIEAFVAANPGKKIDVFKMYDVTDDQAIRLGNYGAQESETTPKGTELKQAVSKISAPSLKKAKDIIAKAVREGDGLTGRELFKSKSKAILDEFQKSGALSPTEYSKKLNSEGEVSVEGVDWVQQVMMETVFPKASELLERLPAVAKEGIEKGLPFIMAVSEDKSVNQSIDNAVKALYSFKESLQGSVQEWKNQVDSVTGKLPVQIYTSFELAVMEALAGTKPNVIAALFRGYFENTIGKIDLWGEVPAMTREQASVTTFGVAWSNPKLLEQITVDTANTNEGRAAAAKDKKSKLSALKKKDKPVEEGEVKIIPEDVAKGAIDNKDLNQEIDIAYDSAQNFRRQIQTATDLAEHAGRNAQIRDTENTDRPREGGDAGDNRITRTVFSKELNENGYVSMVGKEVRSIVDVAEITSITRNPNIEQVTMLFVKGGKVSNFTITTSGMAGSAVVDINEGLARAKDLGADEFYFIHNHPSGDPSPSKEDMQVNLSIWAMSANAGVKYGGSVVLNGDKFSFINQNGTVSQHSYQGGGDLYAPGKTIDNSFTFIVTAKTILSEGNNGVSFILVDQRMRIIDVVALPPFKTGSEGLAYLTGVLKQYGYPSYFLVGDPRQVETKLETEILPGNVIEAFDPIDGTSYEMPSQEITEGIDWLKVVAVQDEQSQFNTEEVDEVKSIIRDNIISGEATSLKAMIKEFIAEELEGHIPSLVQAYKEFKSDPSLSIQIRNALDTFEKINSYDVAKIKAEYEQEKQQQEKDSAANVRRQAELDALNAQSRPVYSSSAGGETGRSERPGLRYAASTRNPVYGSDVVKEIVAQGQYKSLDEHQRYAVNMALTSFKRGERAFLLGDGTGTGKSITGLVMALEMAKITGQESLIITENETIINQNYKAKAGAQLLGMAYLPGVKFGTYSGLISGKIDKDKTYGIIIYDESQNIRNRLTKTAVSAAELKSHAEVFSTATPMDKPEHSHYFLTKLTGMTEEDVQNLLGYEIEYVLNETTKEYELRATIDDTKVYLENLINLRDSLIEQGKMIRREFPFYGSVEEVTIPASEKLLTEEADIETFYEKKTKAARYAAQKGRWNKAKLDQVLENINKAKSMQMSYANEPAKAAFIWSEIQNAIAAGRKPIVVVDIVKPEIELKSLDGKKLETLSSTLIQKLKDAGIKYGEIFGANKAAKEKVAADFQAGKLDAVIMTAQSGGTGIDLDDTVGNQPRTLIMATAPYSGIALQQILGRVSRRNTASPAKVVAVYNDSTSDRKRRKIVERKMATLQAVQDGQMTDGQDLEPAYVRRASSDFVPTVQVNEGERSFRVYNWPYDLKDRMKEMKATGRRDSDGNFYWQFPIDRMHEVQQAIEDIKQDSDVKMSLQEKITKAEKELLAEINAARGMIQVGGIGNAAKVFAKLAQLAGLHFQNGMTRLSDFIDSLKWYKIPADIMELARKAWVAMTQKKRITPRGEIRAAFEALTAKDKVIFTKIVQGMIDTSTDADDLRNKIDAYVAAVQSGMVNTPFATSTLPLIQGYRAIIDPSVALSLSDASIQLKTVSVDAGTLIAQKALERVVVKKKPVNNRFMDRLTNISQGIDRPFAGLSRFFEHPISRLTGNTSGKISLERQAELLAGVQGQARVNVEKIKAQVLGKIKINGQDSPRLGNGERKLFEQYLFAKRAIDRVTKDRSTGNVTAQMGERMVASVINRLPDGRDIKDFEHRAEVFQKLMDDNLQMLLASGRIGQEQYDGIKEKNDFYATFNVVSDDFVTSQGLGGGAIASEANVIKAIKGIAVKLAKDFGIQDLNDLRDSLDRGAIQVDQFYERAITILESQLVTGKITEEQYADAVSKLGTAGFEISSILGAAEEIVYKSTLIASKNVFMREVAKVAEFDVTKELAEIHTVAEGKKPSDYDIGQKRAVVFFQDGVKKVVVMDQLAAETLSTLDIVTLRAFTRGLSAANGLLRGAVITTNPVYLIKNFVFYDMLTTLFLSKFGILAGFDSANPIKGVTKNIAMAIPDMIAAMIQSIAGNVLNERQTGKAMESLAAKLGMNISMDWASLNEYQQYMESPAYTKGIFGGEQMFAFSDTQVRSNLSKVLGPVKFLLETVGAITEQTPKLFALRRLNRQMKDAMATNNGPALENMLMNGYWEIRNQVGSPDFANLPTKLKWASLVFPMLASRVKGITMNSRRVLSALLLPYEAVGGKAENLPKGLRELAYDGESLTKKEKAQILLQILAMMAPMAMYAIMHFKTEDQKQSFKLVNPKVKDDNLLLKTGSTVEIEQNIYDESTRSSENRTFVIEDYVTIPMRGIPGVLNSAILQAVQSASEDNPEAWKKVLNKFITEYSPINFSGQTLEEKIESFASNFNPLVKAPLEVASNKNFYYHYHNVNPYVFKKHQEWMKAVDNDDATMLQAEEAGYAPWQIPNNAPELAKQHSWELYNHAGIKITAGALNVTARNFGLDAKSRDRRFGGDWWSSATRLKHKPYALDKDYILGKKE